MNKRSFVEDVEPLPKEQKISFYLHFSNSLSGYIREYSDHANEYPLDEETMQMINIYAEIMHRCLNRVFDLRFRDEKQSWSEEDIWIQIKNAVRRHPTQTIKDRLSIAVENALNCPL